MSRTLTDYFNQGEASGKKMSSGQALVKNLISMPIMQLVQLNLNTYTYKVGNITLGVKLENTFKCVSWCSFNFIINSLAVFVHSNYLLTCRLLLIDGRFQFYSSQELKDSCFYLF